MSATAAAIFIRRIPALVPLCVAACLAMPCLAHAGEVNDIIKMKAGNVIPGSITDETYEFISYTGGGGAAGKVRQCEVESVQWGDRPDHFNAAEAARARGEFEEAIVRYEKAVKSPLGRKFYLEPYCTYYVGLCYQHLGKLEEAEKGFRKLIKDYPSAKFFPLANIALGEMLMTRQQYDKAIECFSVVGKAVDANLGRPTFCEDIFFTARLRATDALVGKKDYPAALAELDGLIRESERSYPEISLDALRSKAVVLVLQQKTDEALKIYRDIIDKSVKEMQGAITDRETKLSGIVAQCYNGLGEAYLANGGKHKEALMEFLRVVTVLGAAVGNEYPRAVVGAIKCFDALGQKDRAKDLLAEVKRDYPGYPGLKALNLK